MGEKRSWSIVIWNYRTVYLKGNRNKAAVRTNKTRGKENDAECILRTAIRKGQKKKRSTYIETIQSFG